MCYNFRSAWLTPDYSDWPAEWSHVRHVFPFILCAILVTSAQAQVGIYVSTDPDPGCNTIRSGVCYIILTDGWKGARFSLPPQLTCNLVRYPEVADGITAVGDFETGIELTLPECAATRTVLATVSLFGVFEFMRCCPFELQPHADSITGEVELIDCSSNIVPAAWTIAVWTGSEGDECFPRFMPPPRLPFPADGAVDVPLDVVLSWKLERAVGCPDLGEHITHLYFGTNPRPPFIEYITAKDYDVGSLQPGTTYYWQIGARDYGDYVAGPVWSFRTTNSLAIESTTWGRVKALYR